MWKDRSMPGTIYSMTPILLSTTFQDAMNGELLSAPTKQAKALEIDMWLQKHASKDARYVILDDEMIYDKRLHYIGMEEEYITLIPISKEQAAEHMEHRTVEGSETQTLFVRFTSGAWMPSARVLVVTSVLVLP